tara:strand:+ start:15874 stop:16275 length:402 start_codon:yes stop_codon:yes gene_type:complete
MSKKNILVLIGIVYVSLISFGSLSSSNNISMLDFKHIDKIIHLISYAILCLIIFLIFETFKTKASIWSAFLFSAAYGIFIEILQLMITTREFSLLDILSNTVGILIMTSIISLKKQFIVKKLEAYMLFLLIFN